MKKSIKVTLVFVILNFLVISCNSSPDVHLNEFSNKTISYNETINLNNCGGKADSVQSETRTLTKKIEAGSELKVGYQEMIDGSLSLKYSEFRSTSKTITLTAPPGTNMEFVLKWSDNVYAGEISIDGSKGTYVVNVPINVSQESSQDIGGCGETIQTQISPSSTEILQPTVTVLNSSLIIQGNGPFRDQNNKSVGTGVFSKVSFSDGNAKFTQNDLDTNHYQIYRIRVEENKNGCGVSIYDSDKIWFSSSANTELTINGEVVGTLNVNTGKHGVVIALPIKVGDELCAVGYAASGFHIILGPDLYYHYDSYCYRGYC
jgi:hypothetical protein